MWQNIFIMHLYLVIILCADGIQLLRFLTGVSFELRRSIGPAAAKLAPKQFHERFNALTRQMLREDIRRVHFAAHFS